MWLIYPLPVVSLDVMATDATVSGSEKALLQEKIRAQGDVVRQMKKEKKPKEEVRKNQCLEREQRM